MLRFYADKFIILERHLSSMMCAVAMFRAKAFPDWPTEIKAISGDDKVLGQLSASLDELGLPISRAAVERLRGKREELLSMQVLEVEIGQIQSRIYDELGSKWFAKLDDSRIKFYEPPQPLFGEEVFNLFPSAAEDIAEAGKCLALDRATACVFHLMRVAESGLKALGRDLEITYAPSWESYITQIKRNMGRDWGQKDAAWKSREPLFRDLMGDLESIKMAWRNPTMHIVRSYSEEEAFNIFNAVKTLMVRLAKSQVGTTANAL